MLDDLRHFFVRKFCLALVFTTFSASSWCQASWIVTYKNIGTFSSPRITDLNGDGTGDIIIGAGREEFQKCDSAVIALDGKTGKMLWHIGADDQIFGSAALLDITGDGVQDIFIGGRSAELIAVDGRSGRELWRFSKKSAKQKWYGFYNVQFIPDQDHDGLEDILTSNGGNVWAAPHDERKRPPGTLVVISARDGKLIASATMPDKRETYMSVSAIKDGQNDYNIIFGTGGETVAGNLYLTKLSAVLKGDISGSILLDTSAKNGFVAPAVWADITGDQVPDIIANAVEGEIAAYDGRSHKRLWAVKEPNTEAYSSIAIGNFTDDKTPDFFVSYAVGIWPKLEWSSQLMVNGANGKVMYRDSLGFYQTSTPVVADLDGDGWDEAILSVNVHVFDDFNRRQLHNTLMSINFRTNELSEFSETRKGSNISTTPWIGDMDSDGLLDIVYCHATNVNKPYTFDGIAVQRIDTRSPIHARIKWGAYMGSKYDGVFDNEDEKRTGGN